MVISHHECDHWSHSAAHSAGHGSLEHTHGATAFSGVDSYCKAEEHTQQAAHKHTISRADDGTQHKTRLHPHDHAYHHAGHGIYLSSVGFKMPDSSPRKDDSN